MRRSHARWVGGPTWMSDCSSFVSSSVPCSAGHGTQKLFGWFGGARARRDGPVPRVARLPAGPPEGDPRRRQRGRRRRPARPRALTPVAAAAVIGVMVNAIGSVHWSQGAVGHQRRLRVPARVRGRVGLPRLHRRRRRLPRHPHRARGRRVRLGLPRRRRRPGRRLLAPRRPRPPRRRRSRVEVRGEAETETRDAQSPARRTGDARRDPVGPDPRGLRPRRRRLLRPRVAGTPARCRGRGRARTRRSCTSPAGERTR